MICRNFSVHLNYCFFYKRYGPFKRKKSHQDQAKKNEKVLYFFFLLMTLIILTHIIFIKYVTDMSITFILMSIIYYYCLLLREPLSCSVV